MLKPLCAQTDYQAALAAESGMIGAKTPHSASSMRAVIAEAGLANGSIVCPRGIYHKSLRNSVGRQKDACPPYGIKPKRDGICNPVAYV